MHRHGYQGRKFGRERDQRRALLRGLTIELFKRLSITTTLPKAKELRPAAEKLISKAKKGDLSSRRSLIAALGNNIAVANSLVDVIAPQIKRSSGYLRVVKLDQHRVGDHAPLATIKFVDDIKLEPAKTATTETAKQPLTEEKLAAKTATTADKAAPKEDK